MTVKSAAKKRPVRRAKGEATRARLKEAAAAELERVGYHQLRITEVTKRAGVATGLFYHYFVDLKTLVHELLHEFIAQFDALEVIEEGVEKGDWFGRILAHNRVIVTGYAEHAGFMRCIFQAAAEDPELREKWKGMQQRQFKVLVDLMPSIFPDSELSEAEHELVVMSLGSIGENLLRDYYINRSSVMRKLELSQDELAEWLAVIFYRGLFGSNPPAEKLQYAKRILTLSR